MNKILYTLPIWKDKTLDITYEFLVEWISTIILIVGVALTSYNVFPLNLFVGLLGNLGWVAIAIHWRKFSLLVVQILIVALYIGGIVNI